MTIQFGTTKADQTGERTSEKKHRYGNPFKPEIYTILSLAVYTWCKPRGHGATQKLFEGDEQNKRYYEILKETVMNIIPADIDLGCNSCWVPKLPKSAYARGKVLGKPRNVIFIRKMKVIALWGTL
jgi:hypothetical protein